jgi:putative phage-type endonuclease
MTVSMGLALDKALWDVVCPRLREEEKKSLVDNMLHFCGYEYEGGYENGREEIETEKERLPHMLGASQVADVMRRVDAASGRTGNIEIEDVVNRFVELRKEREQLRRLISSPGIKQRTPEWYQARHALVTASDIAQSLGHGKFDTQEAFFEKKVPPILPPAPPPPSSEEGLQPKPQPSDFAVKPHLKWGTMFEDTAAAIYSARNATRVHEFGLIVHPDHPSVPIGASPDGITEMGIMVEIKCPFKRKITGEVPLQYYYQIQGQLEVCRLRHCDYLECEFSEYKTALDFEIDVLDSSDGVSEHDADTHFGTACNGREKGIIAEFESEDGMDVYYKHSKISPTKGEYETWVRDRKEVDDDRDRLKKLHFWRLEVYSVVRVDRDEDFLAHMMRDVNDVWKRVTGFRNDPESFVAFLGQQSGSGSGKSGSSSSSVKNNTNNNRKTTSTSQNKPQQQTTDSSLSALDNSTAHMGEYAFVDEI